MPCPRLRATTPRRGGGGFRGALGDIARLAALRGCTCNAAATCHCSGVTRRKLRGILPGRITEGGTNPAMEAPARERRGRFALVYAAVALYISVGFLDISALPAYLKYVARRDNPHATDDEIAADVAAQLAACSLTSGLLAVGIAGWALSLIHI